VIKDTPNKREREKKESLQQCLVCGGPVSEECQFFYCDDFCEDIGYQAYWYHFIEAPPFENS